METKYVRVPFEVELAKEISNGSKDGRIITNSGCSVRIICFNRRYERPILALIDTESVEICEPYTYNGKISDYETNYKDLMLEIPEYLTYKDGDIIYGEVDNGGGDYCKWLSIVMEVDCIQGKPYVVSYVDYIWDSSYNCGSIEYMAHSDNFDLIRLATEEEKARFAKRLQENKNPVSDEYLEKYFGIKESPKVSNFAKIGKKEELAQAYTDKEVRRYHKHSGVIEKYGMERARMTSEHESWELKEAYEVGWDAGANWRVNSIWHDASEKPDTDKGDLIVCINVMGGVIYVAQSASYVLKYGCVRWAYIDDLIPNKEDK